MYTQTSPIQQMALGSTMRPTKQGFRSLYSLPLPIDQRSQRQDPACIPRSLIAAPVPRPPTAVASPVGMIHVFGYTPAEGEQGVPITVQINFQHMVEEPVYVRLVVGLKPIATKVRELSDSTYGQWKLEGAAPPFDKQTSTTAKVLITVQALNHENVIMDSVTFGEFKYWESDCEFGTLPGSLKRSRETSTLDSSHRPHKSPRPTRQHVNPLPTPPPTSPRRVLPSRSRHRKLPNKRHQPQSLRRTRHAHGELPYGGYAEKAVLDLVTPLEKLCQGWDDSELQMGRRLVKFKREQRGYKLIVSCERISQEDYRESDAVISCIYRDEVDTYFVTSVDIIYLLEKLVDAQFEVEEKNRIRRNLEGLKPTTVSKTKPGFERFFQRIMDFPDPKPRNIEKDLKVFEWTMLAAALNKIISKYSLYSTSVPSFRPASVSSPVHPADIKYDESNTKGPIIDKNPGTAFAFPSDYVDPTDITKCESPDDTLYLCPTNTTEPITSAESYSADVSDAQRSDSSNASWGSDSNRTSAVLEIDAFDMAHATAAAFADDSGAAAAFGFNTFDSLEFQTLKEHSLQPNISDQYLRI